LSTNKKHTLIANHAIGETTLYGIQLLCDCGGEHNTKYYLLLRDPLQMCRQKPNNHTASYHAPWVHAQVHA